MGNTPRYSDSNRDTGGIPGWVKVSGLILVILILLALTMMLLGGGQALHVPRPH